MVPSRTCTAKPTWWVGFSRRLRRLAAKHFGHAAHYFLRRLTEWRARDEAGLLVWLEMRRNFYLAAAHRIDAPGRRLDRAHEKMATVYAACCLSIQFGILPWTRQRVCEALLDCTRGHVALVARDQADAARRQAVPVAVAVASKPRLANSAFNRLAAAAPPTACSNRRSENRYSRPWSSCRWT